MQINNPIQINDWKIEKFLKVILAIQLAMWGAIILDFLGWEIPILREFVGFVYLTFIPGIIILRILKIHKLGNIETLLYTVGLSIATLMFTGLLMNTLYPLIGVSKPILTTPLIITISAIVLVLCVLSYIREKDFSGSNHIEVKEILSPPVLFLILLPFLAILGTYSVNFYENNFLLLLLCIIISLIVLAFALNKVISMKLYSMAVIMIAIALLFHTSLISPYLIGYDIHVEYYLANLVKMNSCWDISTPRTCNAMLSTTMLPTIYSNLIGMDIVGVYKIIYQILFSFVPLGLYYIYQKQTDKETAFLSIFFLMSVASFYGEMTILVRQQIAELFYILIIMLTVTESEMDLLKRKALFIIFSFGMIVSHYGLSYICVFFFSLSLCILYLMKYRSKILTPHSIIIFITLLLSWYLYTASAAPLNSVIHIGEHIHSSLYTDFLNPETRQSFQFQAMKTASPLHELNKILHNITQFFIFVGFCRLVLKYKEMNFRREYVSFSIVNFALIILCVVIPRFEALNFTRMYHITLLVLAPLCVLGGMTILEVISKKLSFVWLHRNKIMSLFLIVFFLFNIGFVYEITGDNPGSLSLSQSSSQYRQNVYTKQEVIGIKWLHDNIDNHPMSRVYVERSIGEALSEGVFGGPSTAFYDNTNRTSIPLRYKSYIYLGRRNIEGNMISLKSASYRSPKKFTNFYNSTFYNNVVIYKSRIYDNWDSQVWN